MQYTQEQPQPLIDLVSMKTHLRVETTTEDAYITGLIAAATSHAEQSMQCSLLTRTIVATFSAGETLCLPRGPVRSVSSLSVGATPAPSGSYSVQSVGTTDYLRYQGGNVQFAAAPMVVTYSAGFGDNPINVPADIIHCIKCHVGLLYENREVAADRTVTAVPFISEFYKLHSREPGVG